MLRSVGTRSRLRFLEKSKAPSRRALPCYQRVVEGQDFVANNLSGLMAFASNKYNIALPRNSDRLGNRLASATDLSRSRPARHDVGPNTGRILPPWIVFSNDPHSSQPHSH